MYMLIIKKSYWLLINRINPSENLSDSRGASSIFYENWSSLILDTYPYVQFFFDILVVWEKESPGWNDVRYGNSCSTWKNVPGNSFLWSCCFLSCRLLNHRSHALQEETILKKAGRWSSEWSTYTIVFRCWDWKRRRRTTGKLQKRCEPQ